ncbi:glycoside hydrolase [Catenovulum agarivorans DS-2]|uniref:Glycoside hydrolase n=1 Tax=Catenovulum agarivorans DS-2 TaxID=1328313 RepID=W7QLE3_9ALTE|nr:family 16 glycosylhydrolase [Catenovulum agarivorans]EWH08958.1 glycoside hydrolase [Catenovulum agarivorans DS-2]
MKIMSYASVLVGASVLAGCQLTSQNDKSLVKPPSSELSTPVGYQWQVIDNMSDEFEGSELDKQKWRDHITTWKGRPPAEFLPKNVAVADGNLLVKTSTHPNPSEKYTMAGGAVSGKHQATYGYFEARIKASNTRMSTTFWLHSDKHENQQLGCERKHAIEIDILEAIGGWYSSFWSSQMHSNTHYKSYQLDETGKCVRSPYLSKGAKHQHDAKLADDYHLFAAWWVNPNLVHFYFDGQLMGTVNVAHDKDQIPFNGPMSLRMVAETYDWQKNIVPAGKPHYPTAQELDDPSINTAYYDFVRSYQLTPKATNLMSNADFEQADLQNWQLHKAEIAQGLGMSYTHDAGLHIRAGGQAEYQLRGIKDGNYQLSFYARTAKANAAAKVEVIDANGNVMAQQSLTANQFTPYQLSLTNLQAGGKIRFVASSGSAVAIDTLAFEKN